MPEANNKWKTKLLLIGTILGAVAGLSTAYLLVRTAEENDSGPPTIKTTDALKAGINLIGLVRGIVALGNRS